MRAAIGIAAMTAAIEEPRKPFWAKCGGCSHCWPAAYAPMELEKFAHTIMAARCPMCGGKKIFVAKQKDGKLLEQGTAA